MLTRKGFNLIEVVVALGIIAMVFAGVVTLIIHTVNLQVQARHRTEAVALAKREVANAITRIGGGCAYTSVIENNRPIDGTIYRVSVRANDPGDTFSHPGAQDGEPIGTIDNNNFVKIRVTISWEYQGDSYEYSTMQIIRRAG